MKNSEKTKKKFGENIKSSEKIISLLIQNPKITITEIASQINLTTRAIEKQIAKLKKENKIRRIGPAKGGYWEVKTIKN